MNRQSEFTNKGRYNSIHNSTVDPSADKVSYDNTESGLTATDVQGAIDEVLDQVDDLSAAKVSYDNTTSGLTATTVQGAIDEVGANLGEISPKVNSLMSRADVIINSAENVAYGESNVKAELDKINGVDYITHYDDSIFANQGFVNKDGKISTQSNWKYNNPILLDDVISITALSELSNPYGGGVSFYKSTTTFNASTLIRNIGSGTGGANEEITISKETIDELISLGAICFLVCKQTSKVSYIDVAKSRESLESMIEKNRDDIEVLNDVLLNDVHIYTTDTEIEIANKMISAFDKGGCNVYWEFGEYNFTDTLFNYLDTISRFHNVGTLELPIGHNCRYYFNNSKITFTRNSYSGYSNGFGVLRSNAGDYKMYNGRIIGNNITYCIHDDGSSQDGTYTHEHYNLYLELNSTSDIAKCIGGGTGKFGKSIVDCCVMKNNNGNVPSDLSYHGCATTMTDYSFFELIIKNCYLSKGVSTDTLAPNQYADLIYCGNSSSIAPNNRARWTKYEYNNEIRQ